MKLRIQIILVLLISGIITAQVNDLSWKTKTGLFDSTKSEHFSVHWLKSNYDLDEIRFFIAEREVAYGKIQNYFMLTDEPKVNLYLFPEQEIKYKITGHRGFGWGIENNIVEVYNDSVKVDPYHELIHIFIYSLGKPNAMIDEGIAIYLSTKFGGSYFHKLLGYPDKSLKEIYIALIRDSQEPDLLTLFDHMEISESQNVPLAYVTSALVVEDLLEKYGKENLFKYLKLCRNSAADKNKIFEKIFNISFEDYAAEFKNRNMN